MFPHEFDRYRIMAFLLRQAMLGESHQRKITQEELAKRLGVSQATISGLAKKPNRATLIRVATEGLKLHPRTIEVLLWLFEGEEYQPLEESEINRFLTYENYPAAGRLQAPAELRAHVLFLIEQLLVRRHDKGARSVQTRMITDWNEAGQLDFRDELLRMEEKPGQRMMFAKYPSLLTYPHSLHGQSARMGDLDPSEQKLEAAATITDRRREVFVTNLTKFGERCIHSRSSLLRYLSDDSGHRLNRLQRREQVENMIALLQRYDSYEVALADAEPETELALKSTVAACLRATERDTYPNQNPIICGPLYVYWYDETTIYSFYLQFERAWDSIHPQYRDKNFVVRWLERALYDTA